MSPASDDIVRTTSEAIIDVVRRDGDAALISLAREYDKVRLKSLEVPRDAWRDALPTIDPALARRDGARCRETFARVHSRRCRSASRYRPSPG